MNHETISHQGARVLLALCLALIPLGLMLFFPTPPPAHAAAMTVNTLSDAIAADGFCSLREAMTNANNNNTSGSAECTAGTVGLDTITITATGIITLTSALPSITGALSIDGPGAALLTISGNNSYRVMLVNYYATLNLSNLTIANGKVIGNGGGIFHALSTLNITNTTFYSNSAFYGGGISSDNGIVNISNTTFYSNSGSLDGGGLYLGASTANIENSSFYSNSVLWGTDQGGGAIYSGNSALNITNTTFYSNSSNVNGGGIWNFGTLRVISSTFSNNRATNLGGAIYSNNGVVFPPPLVTISNSNVYSNTGLHGGGMYNNGPLTIIDTSFYSNSAVSSGGGIINTGKLTVTHSTLSNNIAASGGGISNTVGAMATVTNTTFYSNSATTLGGAIYNSGALTATHSTLSGNSATSGGGIARGAGTAMLRNTIVANNPSGGNCAGTIANGGNNIEDGISCSWGSTDGSLSSMNPLLGPLANNGGATQTMALLFGSPAIDGVTFNAPNGCPSTDQRGIARPIGARCDIGAFEAAAYLRIFLPLVLR